MDNVREPGPLHQAISAGLSDLGMPDPACHSTTFLIRGGHCFGRRFFFDGIQAIWLITENVVQFYNESGELLKTVDIGTAEQEVAQGPSDRDLQPRLSRWTGNLGLHPQRQ